MKIKNMKRNLVNAACIATACTLAACGSSASSTTASSGATTTEASSAAETSEDTPLIGYSLNSMDSTMKTMADYIDDYVVVSIDCSSTGQTYLKSGELDATVLMAMKQLAVSSADYVQEAMDGETVDKKNSVAGYYQLVTPDTYKAVMEENGMTPDE